MVTICNVPATAGGSIRRPEARVALSLSERLPRVFLASRSPRRRRMLDECGLRHDVVHTAVDDGVLSSGPVPPGQWVAALAYLKAASGAAAIDAEALAAREDGLLILGADTVCVKDGELIGQPRDEADARSILERLESGTHDVVTGVALLWVSPAGDRRRELLVDRSRVRVGVIGVERIETYLASGQWRGKAGAYNLTERIEAGWPIEYDGDPTTIMGLPMKALLSRLERAAASEPSPGRLAREQSSDAGN